MHMYAHIYLLISSNTKNTLLVYYKQHKNVFCRLLDSITIHTLVMPTKQNNWAEVGYKNKNNDRAYKKSMHHYCNKNGNNTNIFISRNHIYFLAS